MGTGQFYLISIKDKDGKGYEGEEIYRLTVPPNAPVEQVLVGDRVRPRETHALIRNVDRASRASNDAEVQKNPDGSVDVFFAPKPPAAGRSRTGSRPIPPGSSS